MKYRRFLFDYIIGVSRIVAHRYQKLPYSKSLAKSYFQRLSPDSYQGAFFAGNINIFHFSFINSNIINNFASKKNSTILELGCGFGDLMQVIPYRCNYIGLDWSEKSLMIASHVAEYKNISFYPVCGDAEDIPLSNNIADIILILNLLPYIENFDKLVEGISRVAKDNSCIAVLNPVKNPFWEYEFEGFGINFYKREKIIQKFKKEGFMVANLKQIDYQLIPKTSFLTQHIADYFEFLRG